MPQTVWDSEKLEFLTKIYPYELNKVIADMLSIAESTVKSKARELGLKKSRFRAEPALIQTIKENFNNCSFSELAKLTGRSKSQIVRLSTALGLKRDSDTNKSIRSRVRNNMIKREKIRMKLGFAPLTNLRILSEY